MTRSSESGEWARVRVMFFVLVMMVFLVFCECRVEAVGPPVDASGD